MNGDDGEKFDLNTDGLDKLLKALKNPPTVRVGILGDNAVRGSGTSQTKLNNATIGLFAEVGTSKSPQRSFLRIPIINHLDKYLKAAGLLSPANLRKLLKTGSLRDIMKMVGVVAEQIVSDGFASGGFGEWVPSNMKRKKNHQTLVETQQLRNSITSEVDEGGQ